MDRQAEELEKDPEKMQKSNGRKEGIKSP